MKKGLKIFLFIVLGLGLLLAVGFMVKTDYQVERSIVIDAPKTEIISYVKSYEARKSWSPWSDYDPNMKVTTEGADGEIGSKYMWEGNEEVGKGYLELQAVSADKIEEHLYFEEPFEAEAPVWYAFEDVNDGVKVTWGMRGESPILMTLFMDMEEMIGKDYEKGLSTLKSNLE